MILRAWVVAAFAFLGLGFLTAANAQYSEGSCGGAYRGRDGASYPCSAKRKPVCEQSTGRCQCLERTECPGGKQREEW
jgi:hypothetical protein